MKLEITLNKILFLVLLYPIVLFFPNLIGREGFWLTAPYFFLIFLFLLTFLLIKNRLRIGKERILALLFFLLAISVYNFSTLRYSLPLFFSLYCVLLFMVLSSIEKKTLNHQIIENFLSFYIVLSIPFFFLSNGFTNQQRFMGFVGSPTVYSGLITSLFVIVSLKFKLRSFKFIFLFITTFVLVYLTKTRLLIVFLLIYPIIRVLLTSKVWVNRKRIFLTFYLTTLFIYPLYNLVIEWFPSLVTLRYGNKQDTSFGLRNYLYVTSQKEYFGGNTMEKIFGKGNEYSRRFIENLMEIDLMPHNDYMRILIDWGFLGFVIFSFLLYKLAVKNNYTLFVALVYMILFYSNLVFNIFLISILILMFFAVEEGINKKDYKLN